MIATESMIVVIIMTLATEKPLRDSMKEMISCSTSY